MQFWSERIANPQPKANTSPCRQGARLHHDRVTLGAGSDLTGGRLNSAQVAGLAGTDAAHLGGGVHREEHHVGSGDGRVHGGGDVEVAAGALGRLRSQAAEAAACEVVWATEASSFWVRSDRHELQPNRIQPPLSWPARLAVARPVRWLCRRGIAGGVGLVRGGKELLLEARDSVVALLQQLQALLALLHPLLAFERFDPQLLGFLLDVVDGSPVDHRQQAPPRRQGGDIVRPAQRPGGCGSGGGCHCRSSL